MNPHETEQEPWSMKSITDTPTETVEVTTVPVAKSGPPFKLLVLLLIGVGACVAAFFYFRMEKPQEAGRGPAMESKRNRIVPISVATARVQDVPIQLRTIGNVLPYSVVNVVPQVNGQLMKVHFTQGQFVKKGDLLFQIDSRSYEAAVQQAEGTAAKDRAGIQAAKANLEKDRAQVGMLEANLKKDIASLKYAQQEMARYGTLVQQGAVSHEQSDQMATNATTAQAVIDADRKAVENAQEVLNADRAAIATAEGTLAADMAAVRTAKIQLDWTQIRSPLDGRTGSLNVYEGNVVQANQTTPLVTISQVQPIYIQFTLPEKNLDQIRQAIARNTLSVQALINGEQADTVQGKVSFMQSTVDTTSGTVAMRATFANSSKKLYPGQFVDIVVTMPDEGRTVVVPATALQTSQQGNSVYVVQPNNTVTFVKVDLKRTYGDVAAIGSGLNPGDVVVTDGQLQLTPGAKISIQTGQPGAESTAGSGGRRGRGGHGRHGRGAGGSGGNQDAGVNVKARNGEAGGSGSEASDKSSGSTGNAGNGPAQGDMEPGRFRDTTGGAPTGGAPMGGAH